ncbi:MAG: glycosyltransferase family 2 protein [Planctomycetes bacterium]|nr:glycosyltransferase family 2 protein [Planctomycetota bacterium]MCB9891164.1 glycosyltransferase family 2 protein [Planctomycetota bacterium]MCB9918931.1 glycosyltransferase family 2 protein [Planctomycetota bacterium]
MGRDPVLSIGMPVRNGARWIEEALSSILAQDFADFEVVIRDNASTDDTVAICERIAANDARVSIARNEVNVGGAGNYNLVFEHARGKYFKWAAHDDLCAPGFFRRCVEALERDPSCVVAFPKTRYIDEDDQLLRDSGGTLDLLDADPAARALHLLDFADQNDDVWMSIFGVFRSSALAKTPKIATHVASDQTLLFELAFAGTFREIDEPLFVRRLHPGTSMIEAATPQRLATWFDPKHGKRVVMPMWGLWREMRRVLAAQDLSARDKRRVRARLRKRFLRMAPALAGELKKAAGQVVGRGRSNA